MSFLSKTLTEVLNLQSVFDATQLVCHGDLVQKYHDALLFCRVCSCESDTYMHHINTSKNARRRSILGASCAHYLPEL